MRRQEGSATWLDDQRALRDVLLLPTVPEADLARLGGPRWLVYRRMVRARLARVLEEAFEQLRTAAGAEAFDALIERFLAESPPRSPYLRDVPAEFMRFLEGPSAARIVQALPAFALDLARYEAAMVEVAHVPAQREGVAPLDMQRVAVLCPAVRLLDLAYAVHRWDDEQGEVAPASVSILLYRDAKTGEVETLELNPAAAHIVRGAARQEAPLVDVVQSAAAQSNIALDQAFVESLSTLLADLVERGILLGSR